MDRGPMTVRLSDDERAFLVESAEADDRTMSSQLRYLVKQDRERREGAKQKETR